MQSEKEKHRANKWVAATATPASSEENEKRKNTHTDTHISSTTTRQRKNVLREETQKITKWKTWITTTTTISPPNERTNEQTNEQKNAFRARIAHAGTTEMECQMNNKCNKCTHERMSERTEQILAHSKETTETLFYFRYIPLSHEL